jgi:hypothetical protein
MWRLFFPLRYFKLINTEKTHLDVWPTLALAAIVALPFILVPGTSFFHNGGFLDKLLLLTSALTGFYVAALVAAATFSHDDLDNVIVLGAIELPMKVNGRTVKQSLTRREFACAIFGYLAFSALILSLFSGLFITLSEAPRAGFAALPGFGVLFAPEYFVWVRGTFVVIFAVAVSHLVVATTLGLYYMMDRLYRKEPKVLAEKKGSRAA